MTKQSREWRNREIEVAPTIISEDEGDWATDVGDDVGMNYMPKYGADAWLIDSRGRRPTI